MSSSESQGVGDGGDLLADVGEETVVLRQLAQRIIEQPEGEELPDELVQQALEHTERRHFASPEAASLGR